MSKTEIAVVVNELPDLRDNLDDLLPTPFLKRLQSLPPHLIDKTPAEYQRMFDANNIKLTETIECLRDAFWLEYDRASQQGRKMLMDNVCADICPKRTFRDIYSDELKFAYITCPIIKYDARLNSLLRSKSVNILQDILDAPLYDEDTGKFDSNVARLKLAAIKQLEDRTQGTVVQKSEIKQMTVTVDAGSTAKSVEEIQRQIQEIEIQLRGELPQGEQNG